MNILSEPCHLSQSEQQTRPHKTN